LKQILAIELIFVLCLSVFSTFVLRVEAEYSGPTLLWSYPTGGLIYSVAASGGIVYVCSADSNVYALNAFSGVKIWNFTTRWVVEDTPAIVNGIIYFGDVGGNVYALNIADGTRVWNFTTGIRVDSSPAVANGVMYIGSWDSNVYALDATNGQKIWNYSTAIIWSHNTPHSSVSSVVVGNGAVYAIGGDGYINTLYALNTTNGILLWNTPIGETVTAPTTSPCAGNGLVFVGCSINIPPSPGKADVVAFDATDGTPVWNQTGPAGGFSTPVLGDGALYVSASSSFIYALNAANGALLWNFSGSLFSVPTVVGNEVYAGSWYGYPLDSSPGNIFGLDASTGHVILNYQTKGATAFPGSGSPVVADGVVYVGKGDDVLALGGSLVSTPSPTLSPTVTPTATSSISSYSPSSTPSIPEFPSLAILPLLIAILSIVILLKMKKPSFPKAKLFAEKADN
jgi:outer membrane protein assembly factor BamB